MRPTLHGKRPSGNFKGRASGYSGSHPNGSGGIDFHCSGHRKRSSNDFNGRTSPCVCVYWSGSGGINFHGSGLIDGRQSGSTGESGGNPSAFPA